MSSGDEHDYLGQLHKKVREPFIRVGDHVRLKEGITLTYGPGETKPGEVGLVTKNMGFQSYRGYLRTEVHEGYTLRIDFPNHEGFLAMDDEVKLAIYDRGSNEENLFMLRPMDNW